MDNFNKIVSEFKEATDNQTNELQIPFLQISTPESLNKFINKSEVTEFIFGISQKYNWNKFNLTYFSVSIQNFNVKKFVEDNYIVSIIEHSHDFRVSFVEKSEIKRYSSAGVLAFSADEDSEIILNSGIASESNFNLNNLNLKIRSLIEMPVKDNQYYINLLIANEMGLSFRKRALNDFPLIINNYSNEVVNKINYSINNLISENPKGKIIICEGPPGTGKSYAIRHIIKQIESQVETVVIPVNMVPRLTGPELMETLLTYHKEGKRFLFVIEDADKVITCNDNQEISEILNFGDGIIGETLDSRLILTTNLKKSNINQALTRPGRLCSYIEFNKLEPEHASSVYKRLTGVDINYKESMSLAEIYRSAQPEDIDNTIKVNNSSTGQYL